MDNPADLEAQATQFEDEAAVLEQAGRNLAAQGKLQRAKFLRDRALLLQQTQGRVHTSSTSPLCCSKIYRPASLPWHQQQLYLPARRWRCSCSSGVPSKCCPVAWCHVVAVVSWHDTLGDRYNSASRPAHSHVASLLLPAHPADSCISWCCCKGCPEIGMFCFNADQ